MPGVITLGLQRLLPGGPVALMPQRPSGCTVYEESKLSAAVGPHLLMHTQCGHQALVSHRAVCCQPHSDLAPPFLHISGGESTSFKAHHFAPEIILSRPHPALDGPQLLTDLETGLPDGGNMLPVVKGILLSPGIAASSCAALEAL